MSQKLGKTRRRLRPRLSKLGFIDYFSVVIGITASILTIAIEWGHIPIYIVMSVLMLNCGIMETVLGIKGRRSNYIFALFGAIGAIFVAFLDHFYGNMAFNVFYLFMSIIGFHLWGKHISGGKNIVVRKLSPFQGIVIIISLVIVAISLNILLEHLGGHSTVLDSVATVLIVFASVLGVLRYREQWLVWATADVLILIMWLDTGNPAAIVMRTFFIIGSIVGYFNWLKLPETRKRTCQS
ncbi:nicotinamide mononucleotide transporter [Candidatus Saccharibacteria bacterium]|nr:nicotinamide mononucleotide transporter [Candidatus Saccharibacteria bacterium]